MKVFCIIFQLLILFCSASAQQSFFILKTGLATYNMGTQKELQHDLLETSDVQLKTVQEFPPFFIHGVEVGIKVFKNSIIGLKGDYTSTGGRLYYKDYSGFIAIDQVLAGWQVGLFYQFRINNSVKWQLYGSVVVSNMHTKMLLTSETNIGNLSEVQEIKLKSNNFGICPELILNHKVGKLILHASLGYDFQNASNLKTDDNQHLLLSNGKKVSAEWNGFRMIFGIGVPFIRDKQDQI